MKIIGLKRSSFDEQRYLSAAFGENHRDSITTDDVLTSLSALASAMPDSIKDDIRNSPLFIHEEDTE